MYDAFLDEVCRIAECLQEQKGGFSLCDAFLDVLCRIAECVQEQKGGLSVYDEQKGGFSVYDAFLDVLVENKNDFVCLFMERVDLKTFLKKYPLHFVYKEVCKIERCTCIFY